MTLLLASIPFMILAIAVAIIPLVLALRADHFALQSADSKVTPTSSTNSLPAAA